MRTAKGTVVDRESVVSEVDKGENVALVWDHRHMVEVLGGGHVLGRPWLAVLHDHRQREFFPKLPMFVVRIRALAAYRGSKAGSARWGH